jgi:hypothetical protein
LAVNQERPEIPESVFPKVGELITECWEAEPEERPSFKKIVKRLTRMKFRVMAGVSPWKIWRFVRKIEDWEAHDPDRTLRKLEDNPRPP